MSRLLICLLAFSVFPSLVAAQQLRAVNIMAGPVGSTAKAVSNDIVDLAKSCGLPAVAHDSDGAIENLLAVKEKRYTQFGIMQLDVLEYLKTFEGEDPRIEQAIRGVRVAMPLYNEEVHIVARPGFDRIEDLDGARVAFGSRDSGTFLTTFLLFDLLGIQPRERVEVGAQAALEMLKSGRIDAMSFVDGTPSGLFADLTDEDADYRLIPLDDALLQTVYEPSVIPGGTYPFQPEPVNVIAIDSALLTFNYVPRGRNAYNTRNCQMVADVTSLVSSNLDRLAANGHPKWTDVDVKADVADWLFSACATRGLNPNYRPSCR